MAQSVIGALRVVLGLNAGEFNSGMKKAGNASKRLADDMKKLGATIAATFATDKIVSFASSTIDLFGIQEDAIASVEAVLKTTGSTAGRTSKQLQEAASALQGMTKFGDEAILREVTSNLLTFGNVVGPVFDRAQAATLDLSQQLNQGLKESAIQLGKALNDPIKGIGALSRVGIAFTQQQKDQIKTLVESNKVMEAQGVILDEIDKFYGDAAEAAARTTSGALTQAANAFGDAMEEIGRVIAPAAVAAAGAVKALSEAFAGLSLETKKFIVTAGGMTAVAAPALAAAAAFGLVSAPIIAAVAAIAVLTGAVVAFWPNLKRVAQLAATAFQDIYTAAKTWLVDALEPVVTRVQNFLAAISAAFNKLRGALGLEVVEAAVIRRMETITTGVKLGVDKVNDALKSIGAEQSIAQSIMQQLAPIQDAIAAAWKGPEVEDQEELAAKMVTPYIQTADQAKAARSAIDEIARAQLRLVEQGVSLVDQMKTPYMIMTEQIHALDAALAAGRISAEQYGAAQSKAAYVAQGAYAGAASSIAGSLDQVFGKSKAVASAMALINSYQAFTNAMANIPAPFNIPAAAAALAAGLAQVANINKTTKSSSKGGSSGGSSAGAAGPTQQPQQLMVQGITPGKMFSGDVVRDLANKLLDFQRDGGKVVLQ